MHRDMFYINETFALLPSLLLRRRRWRLFQTHTQNNSVTQSLWLSHSEADNVNVAVFYSLSLKQTLWHSSKKGI